MNTLVKGNITAKSRVDGNGPGDNSTGKILFCSEQRVDGQRGGDLGTVQQSQSFLGFKRERIQPYSLQGLGCRHRAAVPEDFAFSDQRKAHMGQRCKITGCPDRSFFRHHRQYVLRNHLDKPFDYLRSDTGVPLSQAHRLEYQRQTNRLRCQRIANASGVRSHKVALQCRQICRVDPRSGHFAKPGINAVGGRCLLKYRQEYGVALSYLFPRGIGYVNHAGARPQVPQIIKCELGWNEFYCLHQVLLRTADIG